MNGGGNSEVEGGSGIAAAKERMGGNIFAVMCVHSWENRRVRVVKRKVTKLHWK